MNYAGIGSKDLPEGYKHKFFALGRILALSGHTLRSGGAHGADLSFELGCDSAMGKKEIFLPWKGFNGSPSPFYLEKKIPEVLVNIASKLYPRWSIASDGVRRLHARNVQQILGKEASNAGEFSRFVVCYTRRDYEDVQAVGGTLFGVKLAEMFGIPVFNFYREGEAEKFQEYLLTISNGQQNIEIGSL